MERYNFVLVRDRFSRYPEFHPAAILADHGCLQLGIGSVSQVALKLLFRFRELIGST